MIVDSRATTGRPAAMASATAGAQTTGDDATGEVSLATMLVRVS
jgi:hypothetical protein